MDQALAPNRERLTYDELHRQVIKKYAAAHHDTLMLPSQIRNLRNAFPDPRTIAGCKILDIGCGCIGGTQETKYGDHIWAPWLCRLVQLAGGIAVGVDIGFKSELDTFEYHLMDLTSPKALTQFNDRSFDGVNCTNLFSSPHMVLTLKMNRAARAQLIQNIRKQVDRLLKPQGILIAFDQQLDNH